MGQIDLGELRAYESDESISRERPSNQVGSVPRRAPVELARIVERKGEWVFAKGIPGDVYGSRRQLSARGVDVAFWRLEVEVDRKNADVARGVEAGDQVVVAEYPWSSQWHASRPLRAAHDADRVALFDSWAAQTEIALHERVEACAQDPFLTDKRYLRATFTDPQVVADVDLAREHRAGRYVFAVCRDPKRVRDQLLGDPELDRLVDLAIHGHLRDPKVLGFDGRLVPLWANDRAVVASVKDLAVQQALAGPARDKDVAYFVGRPVRDLVRKIFVDHLSRLRKVAIRLRESVKQSAASERVSAGSADHGLPDRERTIELVAERLASSADARRLAAELLVDQHLALLLGMEPASGDAARRPAP